MTMEDQEESGEAHELREIEPNTFSNGHLRWDYHGDRHWIMRYATVGRDGVSLGRIRFSPVWREYIFTPKDGLVLAHDCLKDVSDLLVILNARR